MNKATLLLGSNLGKREDALGKAVQLIEERAGAVILKSHVYDTSPWGKTDQPSFLNIVIVVGTLLDADQLLKELLLIETEMGRKRDNTKWEPRLIDIDILFFNEEVIDKPQLQVPHPLLKERRFALVPLNEIIPAFVHPVLKLTIEELLIACNDRQEVKLYI